jgi:hypothetical protein
LQNKKRSKSGLQSKCKQCDLEYRVENKERIKKYKDVYRKVNAVELAEKQRRYYANNKKYIFEYQRIWMNNRRATDVVFKLKCRLRYLIRAYIKKNGYVNNSKTMEILGCSFSEFKKHIEVKFVGDMSWDRFSEIHIDHVIPLASATTEEDVLRLNHYTNLQPLWAKDNLKKGSSMPSNEITSLVVSDYNEVIKKTCVSE